jgi:hypothetical protein
MFRTEEYSEWDEVGLPTEGDDGERLKLRRQKLMKLWKKQRRMYEQVLEREREDSG